MQEEDRNCCQNSCMNNGSGFLNGLFSGNGNNNSEILFFIIVFLLLFHNSGCGRN